MKKDFISHDISPNIANLCMKEEFSDVVLVVESEKIWCHKNILASNSLYFKALLTSGLRETKQKEIELQDVALETFRPLLEYIYSGRLCLQSDLSMILDILKMADMFVLEALVEDLKDYLDDIIDKENVWEVLEFSLLYGFQDLTDACFSRMDCAKAILESQAFVSLTQSSLKELLCRDKIDVPEIEIFQAVCRWLNKNEASNSVRSEILSGVRVPLISEQDIFVQVKPTGMFSKEELFDACEDRKVKRLDIFKNRSHMSRPGENMVLKATWRSTLYENKDCKGLVVFLKRQCVINFLSFHIPEGSYVGYKVKFLKAKPERLLWTWMIDFLHDFCHGQQRLTFQPIEASFIEILFEGNLDETDSLENNVEVTFQHREDKIGKLVDFDLYTDMAVPTENVASQEMGAISNQPVLLDGTISVTSYATHDISSDPIVIKLAHPYYIDSMRLLLLDVDNRSYSYCIETSRHLTDHFNGDLDSIPEDDWEMLVDRSEESCKSWQTLKFPGRTMTFIRIVGIHNSAGNSFDCVHFECTAEEEDQSEDEESFFLLERAEQTALRNAYLLERNHLNRHLNKI